VNATSTSPQIHEPHYTVIVAPFKDTEVYQRGDSDCEECIVEMIAKCEALAKLFRRRLADARGQR
jgi:hypothetical protein